MNSWHFTASNIPDMAFGLSDHYDWDARSVVVDDATHRRASVQAAYNDSAADFHQMVQFGRHSLDCLSHQWPGVPYPYEKTTEFQGGAGMEYPMMANDESYPDPAFAEFVAAHEIAHTYMPFYMGINETRYAFMDEGWATTFEYLINRVDMGVDKRDQPVPAVSRESVGAGSVAVGGSADHHAGRCAHRRVVRHQRVRQAGAGLPGDEGSAGRRDVPEVPPCLHGPLARQASHALGLLLHLQQRLGPEPRLVLEQLVLQPQLHRSGGQGCREVGRDATP